jgi:hypothetical protein
VIPKLLTKNTPAPNARIPSLAPRPLGDIHNTIPPQFSSLGLFGEHVAFPDASRQQLPEALVEVLAAHIAAMGLTAADSDRLLFAAPSGNLRSYPELAQAGAAPCG